MPDERPRGSCVIDGCPRDPWRRDDGRLPLVCGPDVSRMRYWLGEIPVLCGELQAKDAPDEVTVRAEVRERLVGWQARHGWHPPLLLHELWQVEEILVASALPAAPTAAAAHGGRVSGSAEPRLPISVDAVDLLSPARSIRRTVDEDDIGYLSVASTLDFWVQDLRDHRARGEGLPEPSVTVLAGWLLERIDEAADDWLPIDEMYEDLRRAHAALRGQLGLIDVPDYRHGIPCPKCNALALVRQADIERVECGSCHILLTIPEYEEHVLSMSTEAIAERKRAAVERRAVVRLLREMHAVGWRHTLEFEESERDDDGALVHEGYLIHRWQRGGMRLDSVHYVHSGVLVGGLYFTEAHADDDPVVSLSIGTEYIAQYGVARLHKLASAAGVLSAAREANGGH